MISKHVLYILKITGRDRTPLWVLYCQPYAKVPILSNNMA